MSRIDELEVVIRRKNGTVTAAIPAIRLYASASDDQAALQALEEKKRALVRDLTEAGELENFEVRAVPSGSMPSVTQSTTGQFALRAFIVTALIAGAVIVSGVVLSSRVEAIVDRTLAQSEKFTKIGGRQFWSKLEAELDRMADPRYGLPEEKKKKLLSDIRSIAAQLRPFVAEIAPVFADIPAGNSSPAAPLDK